jgi:hypothetical protein
MDSGIIKFNVPHGGGDEMRVGIICERGQTLECSLLSINALGLTDDIIRAHYPLVANMDMSITHDDMIEYIPQRLIRSLTPHNMRDISIVPIDKEWITFIHRPQDNTIVDAIGIYLYKQVPDMFNGKYVDVLKPIYIAKGCKVIVEIGWRIV